MARYIYGWIECKNRHPLPGEPAWAPVIELHHLLQMIKDADGFHALFVEDSLAYRLFTDAAAHFKATSLGISDDDSVHFRPVFPQRGLPADVSPQVQAEYNRFDGGAQHMPPCDVITSTPAEWISWREMTQAELDRMEKLPDDPPPEVHRNEQGDLVYRFWLKRVSRPPVSWATWQELQQVDWAEEATWIDRTVYEFHRNAQGELTPQPSWSTLPRGFEERVGRAQLDYSQEQTWDLGDVVYHTKQVTMTRKEALANWDHVWTVLELLAQKYGDEGVRVIAWLS